MSGPPRADEHRAAEPQPKERGCVRRGPAAAAAKRRGHPLKSGASRAANLLRLVLRAHSRAPREILAPRDDFAELKFRTAEPQPKRSAAVPAAAATPEPGRWQSVAPSRVRRRCGRGPPARRKSRGARGVWRIEVQGKTKGGVATRNSPASDSMSASEFFVGSRFIVSLGSSRLGSTAPREISRNHEGHERRRAGGCGSCQPADELFGCRGTTLPPFVFGLFVSFLSFVVQSDCRFHVYRRKALLGARAY